MKKKYDLQLNLWLNKIKMQNQIIIFLFGLFAILPAFLVAQTETLRKCGFEHFDYTAYQTPDVSNELAARTNDIYEIPVVFHVIKKTEENDLVSKEEVLNQVEILNEDFRFAHDDVNAIPNEFQHLGTDVGIEFCLAGVTWDVLDYPEGKEKRIDFIERDIKPFTAWDTRLYLNVWVIDLPGNYIGYSHLPAEPILHSTADGIVLDYKYLGRKGADIRGRTLVHEIGHYLGLYHTWGENDEEGEPFGCSSDDGITDTPNQEGPHYGCPTEAERSCNSSDMYVNYMDYVSDPCLLMFTPLQVAVMRSNLEKLRSDLINNAEGNCETKIQSNVLYFVYPNPFIDNFTIETRSNVDDYTIYDAYGNKVLRNSSFTKKIVVDDLAHYPAGVYFVVLQIGNTDRIIKLVKS